MRVSQRVDYALRTVVALAAYPAGEVVPAGVLAQRLTLPRRFVEQQLTALVRVGIVGAKRGASGGCYLARPAASITALDVVTTIEGTACDVPRQPGSAVAEMWESMSEGVATTLASVSIADLASRQRELSEPAAAVYYI